MKILNIAILLMLFTLSLTAQPHIKIEEKNYDQFFGDGYFTIKGKIENKPANMNSWRLAVTGYLTHSSYTIPIEEDGSFFEQIPVKDIQDVYLYLNTLIAIFTFPGDTVEMYYDAKDFNGTIGFKGKNAERQKNLDLSLSLSKHFRQAYLDINRLPSNKELTEGEKIEKLNEYYGKKIQVINDFEEKNGTFFFREKYNNDAFFQVAVVAVKISPSTLPQLRCDFPYEIKHIHITNGERREEVIKKQPYESIDFNNFRYSINYRDFLYVHMDKSLIKLNTRNYYEPTKYTPVKDRHHIAMANLKVIPVRDWYIAYLLSNYMSGRENFEEITAVYNEFKSVCTNPEYISVLEPKYQNLKATQPGQPLPDFELTDIDGNSFLFSDLKGKIVYIDFWATWCTPCIHEIKNFKEKFYDTYKDYDIVYVYISVDNTEKAWKNGVEKYNIDGIHLFIDGYDDFTQHPVCKFFNVTGIPHYVLIDKNGKIVKNDCDRPSSILSKEGDSWFDNFISGEPYH